MNKELPKVYEPQEVEGRIYEMWEKNGCFVKLSLSDGEGDIINMTVLVSDESCAKDIEKRFRRDAEIMYGKIVNLLTDGALDK